MEEKIAEAAKGLADAGFIVIQFLKDTDPLGSALVFIFGLWRGWWVMGSTHKEVKRRLFRLEDVVEKLAIATNRSTAVTMGVVKQAHLAHQKDLEGNEATPDDG